MFIKNKSEENKSSSKIFYITIKYCDNTKEKNINIDKELIAINYLNEAYFKIKETLSRCGNIIYDINSKEEVKKIFFDFFKKK